MESSTTRITAREVRVGDRPISLAGFRPATKVTRHHNGQVTIRVGATKFKVPGDQKVLVKR